jgi:para-aminobenzoate synthetase/4-amino-4-deoxychorismate lyase
MPEQRPAPTALIDFPADLADPQQRLRLRAHQPSRWLVAHDPSQVQRLLDDVHAWTTSEGPGHWAVGWVAYEAAPAFDPSLPVKALPPGAPYAVWALYEGDQVEVLAAAGPDHPLVTGPTSPWHLGPWLADTTAERAQQQVEQVRELIRQGEVYQINLTMRLQAPLSAHTEGLLHCFDALHRSQPLGYTAFLDSRAATRGPGAVLSVSPELFFDWTGPQHGQVLTTRPMKGTAPRLPDPAADHAQAQHLVHSDKERAENLMIVDLLRNDVAKVAEVGSVKVPSLFDVQALPTVWQMTSTVKARTRAGLRLSEVMGALFPCGSVTGAPKRQAMHHIARMERAPRHVYCGAMGLMRPGGHVTFNVPIRTVAVHTPPPDAPWTAHCGVGSGITLDATPQAEWQEWQHKQRFLQRAVAPFELLESLRLENGVLARLPRHLARLQRAALHFGYPYPQAAIEAQLASLCTAHPEGVFKVRLRLGAQTQVQAEAAPLTSPAGTEPPQPRGVALADRPMAEADDFVWHKTTWRPHYEAFRAPPGCFDTLLHNSAGELTEFTIGNLALKLDGQWLTPPVRCGLLPGVMREQLLDDGTLREQVLHLHDLARAESLALLNSVRGWVPVVLVQSAVASSSD